MDDESTVRIVLMPSGESAEIECTNELCSDCSRVDEYNNTGRMACSLFGGTMRRAPDMDHFRLVACKKAEQPVAADGEGGT